VAVPPRPETLGARRAERKRVRQVEANRPLDRVQPSGVIWVSWRWVSGTMTGVLILVLYGLLASDAFYVSSIAVGGANYLTNEEIFGFTDISDMHIFWVDPAEVEARLESNNNIAEADVRVGWPPQMVQVIVRERDPVLTWEQANDRVWVDINGTVMYQRTDRPDLLRVVYDPNEPASREALGKGSRIPLRVVQGALLLKSRLPYINVLLYHPIKGLGWRDPHGWTAWFGFGENMAMKALVYEALVTENNDQVQFSEIDVSDPDNPVYTILFRKT